MVTAAGRQSMKSDAAATVKCPKCGNPVQFKYHATLNRRGEPVITVEVPDACHACGEKFGKTDEQLDRLEKRKAYDREYRQKNKDKIQEYASARRAKNPERVKEIDRQSRQMRREKINAYQREYMKAWRKKNPGHWKKNLTDDAIERRRESCRRYQERNKEKIAERKKKYYQRNKEAIARRSLANYHRRKEAKANQ